MLPGFSKLVILLVFAVASQAAWGRLPQGPNATELRQLVERIHLEARALTDRESRDRIEAFIRERAGDDASLYNNAGVILLFQYYPHEAQWAVASAVLRDFESAEAMNNLAVLLTNQQQYSEAERVLLYVVNRWPGSSTPLLNLGRLYTDKGRLDLAQECVDLAFAAGPGRADTEKLAARIAITRRDTQAAAEHVLNLEMLDPGNPQMEILREKVPRQALVDEQLRRIGRYPMPLWYTELNDIEKEVDVFVIKETEWQYWQNLAQRMSVATQPSYENFKMTEDIWRQIPPEMQATLERLGAGPGSIQPTMAPGTSRAQYKLIADVIQAYEKSYLQKIASAYETPELVGLLDEERAQQKEYQRRYKEAARTDPEGAWRRYLSEAVPALERAHPIVRETLLKARADANRITLGYWAAGTALLTMVPEAYRAKELDALNKLVTLSNLHYTKYVLSWYGIAKLPVLADKTDAELVRQQLHEAAAAREHEARIRRDAIQERRDLAEWEEWLAEEPEYVWPEEFRPWVGPCIEIACVKAHFDPDNPHDLRDLEVGVGLPVGPKAELVASDDELVIAAGFGFGTPDPVPGYSQKYMCGVVLGGEHGIDIRLYRSTSLELATPVGGIDIDLSAASISLTDVAIRQLEALPFPPAG